jgi:hypothetical protein
LSDPLNAHPNFEVIRRLAVGGMGEVLLTRFTGNQWVTGGFVVVKRTIPDHPNRAHQDEMLREEGRVALRLRHGNLVETFALDELDGHPLLVMEFLAGRSMAQVLGQAKRKKRPIPVEVAVAVLRESACGLHFAHTLKERGETLGLVHRDVSPANIFATYDGKCKVIDFGVAKADDSEIKTSAGILKGKLGYMSPEHAKGEQLDPRADLWSLGVLFWEMLVADRLFGGQNPAMTLYNITQGEVDAPTKRRPDVPAPVEELCMMLLTKDRELRVQSGRELVQLIEAMPENLWKNVDIGGFMSTRFPAEAEKGRRETTDVARPIKRAAVPVGLVDGGAFDTEDEEEEMKTLVVDGGDLLAQAKKAGLLSAEAMRALEHGYGDSKNDLPAEEVLDDFDFNEDEVDDEAKTEAIDPAMAAAAVAAAHAQAAAERHQSGPLSRPALPGAPTVQQMPAVDPMPPGGAAPLPQVSLDAATKPATSVPVASDPTATGQTTKPAFAPGLGSGSHPRPLRDGPKSVRGVEAVPSGPQRVPSGPQRVPSGPQRVPSGPQRVPSGPQRVPSGPQKVPSAANRKRKRRRGPSAVAVAASTFGALALIMGLAFAYVSEQRQAKSVPSFVGYPGDSGTDIVVAFPQDVPKGKKGFQVPVDNALLRVTQGEGRVTIAPDEIERMLREAKVWERALMPRTSRQKLSAALPAGIALLGLLSLAFGLPGLLVPRQVVLSSLMRVLLIGGVAVAAGWVMLEGALGWPGTKKLDEMSEQFTLKMGKPVAVEKKKDLSPEDAKQLEELITKSVKARSKRRFKDALTFANNAAALAPDHPQVQRALGYAHKSLENHSKAVEHLKKYLELQPKAVDKKKVDAYLQKMKNR